VESHPTGHHDTVISPRDRGLSLFGPGARPHLVARSPGPGPPSPYRCVRPAAGTDLTPTPSIISPLTASPCPVRPACPFPPDRIQRCRDACVATRSDYSRRRRRPPRRRAGATPPAHPVAAARQEGQTAGGQPSRRRFSVVEFDFRSLTRTRCAADGVGRRRSRSSRAAAAETRDRAGLGRVEPTATKATSRVR